MPVPVHELATTEQYLPVLDGHETVFPAGERFAYNNGGYVVLALLAERASGVDFHELVRTLVCEPAGMVDTAFLRSDELPDAPPWATSSVDGLRTNVLHLPVLGSGDGGIYSTAADLSAFWDALFAGRIVSPERVAEMVRPRSDWPEESRRYGLGFHLHATGDGVWLEGYDAGVSFASLHQPSSSITYTVISNWSDGAWPIVGAARRTARHLSHVHRVWGEDSCEHLDEPLVPRLRGLEKAFGGRMGETTHGAAHPPRWPAGPGPDIPDSPVWPGWLPSCPRLPAGDVPLRPRTCRPASAGNGPVLRRRSRSHGRSPR